MTRTRNGRTAFTLTEMLVVLGVILILASIAVMVVPGAVAKDRTTDAAALVRLQLTTAKNRAARDGLPRGVRFIVAADPEVPTKSPLWVTTMQDIEAPLVIVPNINQTTTFDLSLLPATGLTSASPAVAVQYTIETNTMSPAFGTIINRQIFLRNLTADQINELRPGAYLSVPEFNNYWVRILGSAAVSGGVVLTLADQNGNVQSGATFPTTYPDDYMGAAGVATGGTTAVVSYRFGIYAPPAPLMGAPLVPLPKNICVDLSMATGPTGTFPYTEAPSFPAPSGVFDYNILFAPNGQVVTTPGTTASQGQIFLWVRDYTKVPSPLVVTGQTAGPPVQNIYDMNVFRLAGEQQLVSLKTKSGALGVFPVTWPDQATGVYQPGQNAYTFARLGATGP